MRPRGARQICLFTLATALACALGCANAPQTAEPPEAAASEPAAQEAAASAGPAATGRAASFSAERAWAHLAALVGFGPRPVGSEGSAKARDYLMEQLRGFGLEAEVDVQDLFVEPGEEVAAPESTGSGGSPGEASAGTHFVVRNVVATVAGQDADGEIVLMAPYDTPAQGVGVNDGASGAAVLLEMARVLAADPLPYATRIVFLDAHAPFLVPGEKNERANGGEFALARRLENAVEVRLALYMNRVGDADLRIARDLLSHRIYREQFWKAAGDLGYGDAFPPKAEFESSRLDHRTLAAAGVRRIVSLVDTHYGEGEPPGALAGTADDTLENCSPQSLGTVGRVALRGLELISEWMLRIDRFTELGQQGANPPDGGPEIEPDVELAPQDTRPSP